MQKQLSCTRASFVAMQENIPNSMLETCSKSGLHGEDSNDSGEACCQAIINATAFLAVGGQCNQRYSTTHCVRRSTITGVHCHDQSMDLGVPGHPRGTHRYELVKCPRLAQLTVTAIVTMKSEVV